MSLPSSHSFPLRKRAPFLRGLPAPALLSDLRYAVFKVRLEEFVWPHMGDLVGSSGLEPPTSCLSGTRSNQLSYEPTMVEMSGFEPLASCVQSRRSPN